MLKRKVILTLAIILAIVALASLGAQIFMAFYANSELRSDMQVMAAQISARSGLAAPSSDEDLHKDILRRAQQHGIELTPNQITVRRTANSLLDQEIYLAADYRQPIHLVGLTFTLHFTPAARHQFTPGDWR